MDFRTHKKINDKTKEIIKSSSMKVECKLGRILEDRGINQTELSILTGIRQPSINDIIHDRKHTINKQHLLAIMLTLKLNKITDLYEVVFDNPEEEVQIQKEKEYCEMNGLLPEMEQILADKRK